MDTSFWTQLNQIVKIKSTKKLFHDTYLYKLKVFAPGVRLLRYDSDLPMQERLDSLIKYVNNFTKNQYYFSIATDSNLQLSDSEQLDDLKKFIVDNKDVKVRIEEPAISFYSNNIEKLKTIANLRYERVEEIHMPESDSECKILTEGNIIASKYNEYKYKIMLNGFYDKQLIPTIQNIFANSDIDLYAIKRIRKQLRHGYYPGGYIYTNDLQITFLLNLVKPNFVRKIYNLVSSTTK